MTGITNEMVRDAASISGAISEFIDFIGDDVLVGHNVHFDINFLYDVALSELSHVLGNDFVDTLRISRRLLKDSRDHKLDTIAEHYKIAPRNLHRSLSDCELTSECYLQMKAHIVIAPSQSLIWYNSLVTLISPEVL